ncbi:hypothetical protein R1flu_029294 [Riccia fluitans]|uniref:Uncharacterized protein n=1 Tax=Riccia fluitans TaxID=41844 RepID=A0ABD1XS47_9MARC
MTTILNPTRTRGLEINHRGQKGVNVRLHGVGPRIQVPPSQSGKQTGYLIKPSGAKAGENISINGGGLIIRARNDKRQTITARSTPDNQLQVQVGQGKSAVQLSIQVTPQGSRGEGEWECVRNREENGDTTSYTGSVKRPEEESRTYNQRQREKSPGAYQNSPQRYDHSSARSYSPTERRESQPDIFRDYHPEISRAFTPERSQNSSERRGDNFPAAYHGQSQRSYRPEAHAFQDKAACTCPLERHKSHQAPPRRNERAQAQNIDISQIKPMHQEKNYAPQKPIKESAEEYDADIQ